MKKTLKALSALALALGMAGTAQSVSLSNLLAGGSITVGDKLFDNWSLVQYLASDPDRTFNGGNIDVTGIDDGGDYGLRFSVSAGELYVSGDDIYAFVDLTFGFKVTVTDPNWLITDNTLEMTYVSDFSYAVDGSNDLGIFILENVGTAAGLDDLAIKEVTANVLDDLETSELLDTAAFLPQNEIWVTKNILVWSQDLGDSVSLYEFTQRFSQTAVPEPGTALLFGLGLAGIGLARRRRV